MTIYVVAGSVQEYERWLGKGGTRYEGESVKLLPGHRFIRIMKPHDKLVLLEGWRKHPQSEAIYNTMLATGRRGDR